MLESFEFASVAFAVMIAGIMPIVCAGIAKWGRKDYDNHNPRIWYASLEGMSARANAAQHNCFEAFPFFAVGVIWSVLGGAEVETIEFVTWLFIAARVAYVACYLADKAAWRSMCWTVGFGCVIYLYAIAFL
ncbi:MAG: MAPEG family protein [Alphaproteobacteria bacterium]|nr:MAPEG family protein [Alphaproteobacteria bacterium]